MVGRLEEEQVDHVEELLVARGALRLCCSLYGRSPRWGRLGNAPMVLSATSSVPGERVWDLEFPFSRAEKAFAGDKMLMRPLCPSASASPPPSSSS